MVPQQRCIQQQVIIILPSRCHCSRSSLLCQTLIPILERTLNELHAQLPALSCPRRSCRRQSRSSDGGVARGFWCAWFLAHILIFDLVMAACDVGPSAFSHRACNINTNDGSAVLNVSLYAPLPPSPSLSVLCLFRSLA
jgi:hypothetical protein